MVTIPLVKYETYYGLSATLLCIITNFGPSVYMVYWKRFINNATTIITSETIGVVGSSIDNPSITIAFARESMSGEYSCFAVNNVGTGSSLPVVLTGK